MPSAEEAPKESHGEKRRKLLELLKDMSKGQTDVPQSGGKKIPGRPPKQTKQITAGLRIRDTQGGQTDNATSYKQVKRPLGDKNVITLNIQVDVTYDGLIQCLKEAFFPGGLNPVVGHSDDYDMEAVNCSNMILSQDPQSDFTLRRYLSEKMISGSFRIHLLLKPRITLTPEVTDGDVNEDTAAGDNTNEDTRNSMSPDASEDFFQDPTLPDLQLTSASTAALDRAVLEACEGTSVSVLVAAGDPPYFAELLPESSSWCAPEESFDVDHSGQPVHVDDPHSPNPGSAQLLDTGTPTVDI